MIIREWGSKRGIPLSYLIELENMLGRGWSDVAQTEYNTPTGQPGSESRQQSLVFLEAAAKDILLFRNNVGALPDRGNRWVRYGLANETEKQHDKFKSGDLIGIRRRLIEPHHVGLIIGQFVSREVKKEDWHHTGTEHELAQDNWADLINAYGGDAKYTTGKGSFD